MTMMVGFSKLVGYFLLFHCYTAWPTGKNDHVTMSGEPTHFQVDDKAAELEINANAMGVKVNAKPASLQVVSKPGAPSIPVAHPAVVVPQLPPPYFPAPFYPSPMVVGHHRTVRRRHHFFNMDPSMGNWNFKKDSVPRKKKSNEHKNSKKSEISSGKKNNHKKRQWIQRLPVLAQLVPYSQLTNVRVHPLVQQMAAISQGAMRQSIPHLSYVQMYQPRTLQMYNTAPSLPQMYSMRQRFPYVSPSPNIQQNGELRNAIHRAIFLPSIPGNQRMYTTTTMMPLVHQSLSYSNPSMPLGPLSGYNGYYDPIISRDFVPDFGTPGMPHIPVPTSRAFIPGGMSGGMTYPGYTPLGLWQRVTKRLTIPRRPRMKRPGTKRITVQHAGVKTQENNPQEKNLSEKSREKRYVREPRANKGKSPEKQDTSYHGDGDNENVAKRQFILTRPIVPQAQQVVTYVPVVTSPQVQAPVMQTMSAPVGVRRNLVLNLPSKTSGTFVLNMPSHSPGPQMYSTNPPGPVVSAFYRPVINPAILGPQQDNNAAMGMARSGIVMRAPVRSVGVPLSELAGIQGRPILQNSRHLTMFYNNDQLPTQVQDQIFGSSSLEGRTRIPGRKRRRRLRSRHPNRFDEMDREDAYREDSGYEPSSYNDESTSDSLPERVDDEGSYTERILPDGRTVLKKDHVGFGPITVQAKTAEAASRDQDDVTDMDLDSDKRKQIPRPSRQRSYLDKRLGIPKPEDN